MFSNATKDLLKTKLPHLPAVASERSLRHDIDELVAAVLPPMKIAVVDDEQTGAVLGEHVETALRSRFATVHVRLASKPRADDETVELIRDQAKGCGALVAVGSGTINDLCKYAAFLDNKPYIVFPTAASMNGFLSANASISFDGYKRTCVAQMPRAVFCDRSIIARAPSRLSKSGLGDCLARPTAQADWLMSHLVLGTDYDETPFALIKPLEPELFDCARGIAKGDADSIDLLMRVLLLSGLGMTIAGGSFPASQGEHMIAHAYEMAMVHSPNPAHPGEKVLHGEAIGVTALAMARRQEALLGTEPELLPAIFNAAQVSELYGAHAAEEAHKAFAEKQKRLPAAPNRLKDWGNIAGRLEKIMLPSAHMTSILERAEAPVTHHQLGWTNETYLAVSSTARFLRDRFTFLDLH